MTELGLIDWLRALVKLQADWELDVLSASKTLPDGGRMTATLITGLPIRLENEAGDSILVPGMAL